MKRSCYFAPRLLVWALFLGSSAIGFAKPKAAIPPGIVTVEGHVSFIEERDDIYLEIISKGRTFGLEIPRHLKDALRKFVEKGTPLSATGRARRGDSSVAFILPIRQKSQLAFGGPKAIERRLVGLPPNKEPKLRQPVLMLSAIGLWPPQTAQSITQSLKSHRYGAAHRLIIDTGLTELWRAYQQPKAFLQTLARAAVAAKRAKIKTAFYFPSFEIRDTAGSRSRKQFSRSTKAWAQHTLTGHPWFKSKFLASEFWNQSGDQVVWACPNSPWRQTFFRQIRNSVKAGVELVFVDVSYFRWQDGHITCRCQHCQKRFHRETGLRIPKSIKKGGKDVARWLAWRSMLLVDFLRELRQTIRKVNPKAGLIVEEYPSIEPDGPRQAGFEASLLGNSVDGVAHENSAKQFDNKAYSYGDQLDLAAALALYRGLDQERATWVLSYAHNQKQSQKAAAMHLAFDASFWETKAPEMNDTSVGLPWRRKLFAWYSKYQHHFGTSEQASRLVLLYSATSRRQSRRHFEALMKSQRDLLEAKLPYRIVAEDQLGDVAEADLLMLPGVSQLSNSALEQLAKRKGETLGWGIHLTGVTPIAPAELLKYVKQTPLLVEGTGVVANLVRRGDQLQIRLVNLRSVPTTVSLRLIAPTLKKETHAYQLTFLGEKRPLKWVRQGQTLSVKVELETMMLIGLAK